MKYKIIVFDLHGTLIDTMKVFAAVASDLISANYKIPKEDARKLYLETSGLPFFQQLEVMFPGNKLNEKVAVVYEETKGDNLKPSDLVMKPDEKEALRILAKRGHCLSVSSGGIQKIVNQFVAECDVPFTHALGYRDGFDKGKAHFDYILEEEGGVAADIVLIGDSLRDMQKAREYGAGFIAKIGTFQKGDFGDVPAVEHLRELVHIV